MASLKGKLLIRHFKLEYDFEYEGMDEYEVRNAVAALVTELVNPEIIEHQTDENETMTGNGL